MVTEGAWWQTMADDAAWQGQWEARRALAAKGAQWRSVADGVAWQGLGWQLTMDVRCERSCRFSAAPCRSQFRTSEQVQEFKTRPHPPPSVKCPKTQDQERGVQGQTCRRGRGVSRVVSSVERGVVHPQPHRWVVVFFRGARGADATDRLHDNDLCV